ncbi:MAG TPA: carboxypeptidase-like regulatory domain-containing protein [Planctomycetota bacterium]|nr:carboxypeptidase-like regulatory domain-containing protein [Planctomycetota bacterium]
MQRSVVLGLILVVAAVLGAIWFLSRGDALPPPPVATPGAVAQQPTTEIGESHALQRGAMPAATQRETVVTKPANVLDDPEIRAGLCGFKGRVVDHEKVAVADTGVRIYRGALDSVLPEGMDVFADEATFVPQYIAGETRTAADGRFQITGVWPRAFYLLYAGIGGDAPTYQIVTKTPSPGEIVDLGDVVLADAGVIVGTVLDDNGDALPGALVRAADLPGTLAAFFPVERFDPEGAVLIREPQSPVKVLEMPSWVKGVFDNLPIPTTYTDGEGRFRLVGVAPGSNLLATTMRGFLSDMKPSIQVRAGQEKDVGRIRLKRGEELIGKVLDTAGKPVAEAEVIAGSTLSMAPVDLAQKLGKTDAEGRFQGQGFAPGKVTVAARRGKGYPWLLAEPQPVLGEVVVTLPATFGVAVSVTLEDGSPVESPRFKLLQGKAGEGAAEMNMLGFVPAIDLHDRQKDVGKGQWRIENLAAGQYTLLADAPGLAVAFAAFAITTEDAAVVLKLPTPQRFPVLVLDQEEKPVRNATIYAQARGENLTDMPVCCGRTGSDGRLDIDTMRAETLRVSAEHPRWGVVNGEAKANEQLVLRMQPPGSLHVVLSENGHPPEIGRFSVAIERRRGNEPRGPLEQVPTLVTPGLDGSISVAALQPGSYRVHAFQAIDALRTPGGVVTMAQDAMMGGGGPSESVEVDVLSGQTAEAQLDVGEKPIEGPTAQILGSVTVDGRRAVGYLVTARSQRRRFSAQVDERGRFDLGTVPAAGLSVNVTSVGEGGVLFGSGSTLWNTQLNLEAGAVKELTIEISTASIAGVVYQPDGSPATGVYVQAQGKLKGVDGNGGSSWLGSPTDAKGAFRFAPIAEGTWTLQVRSGGDRSNPMRGELKDLVVTGGVPMDALRIELHAALLVKGRVDTRVWGDKKPRWAWVAFHRPHEAGAPGAAGDYVDGAGIDSDGGAFSTSDLPPGQYHVRVHAQFDENGPGVEYTCDDLTVPENGLQDVVLVPRPRAQ